MHYKFLFLLILGFHLACSENSSSDSSNAEVSSNFKNKSGATEIKFLGDKHHLIDQESFKDYLISQLIVAQEMGEAESFYDNETEPLRPYSEIREVRVIVTSALDYAVGASSQTTEGNKELKDSKTQKKTEEMTKEIDGEILKVDGNGLLIEGRGQILGVKLSADIVNAQANGDDGKVTNISLGKHFFGVSGELNGAIGFKLSADQIAKIASALAGNPDLTLFLKSLDELKNINVEDDRYFKYSNEESLSIPMNGIWYDLSATLSQIAVFIKKKRRVSNFTKNLYYALVPSLCSSQRGGKDGEILAGCDTKWTDTLENYKNWLVTPDASKPFLVTPVKYCKVGNDPNEIMIYFPVGSVDYDRIHYKNVKLHFSTGVVGANNQISLKSAPGVYAKNTSDLNAEFKNVNFGLELCDKDRSIVSASTKQEFKAKEIDKYACASKAINTKAFTGAVECQNNRPVFTYKKAWQRKNLEPGDWKDLYITYQSRGEGGSYNTKSAPYSNQ